MIFDAAQKATIKSIGGYDKFFGKKKKKELSIRAIKRMVHGITSKPKKKKHFHKKDGIPHFDTKKPLKWYIHKRGEQVVPSEAENRIRVFLNTYDVEFHYEVSFDGLGNSQSPYRFDFWIPSVNLIIEYDGKGYHKSEVNKKRDSIKNAFCKAYKLKIVRLNRKHWNDLEGILTKKLFLLGIK